MKVHKKHKIKREVVKIKHKHSRRIEKKAKQHKNHNSVLNRHKNFDLVRYPKEKSINKPEAKKHALHIIKNNKSSIHHPSHKSYKKLAPHQIHDPDHQIKAYKKAAEDKSTPETEYSIDVDGAKVEVEIRKQDDSYVYTLNIPKFNVGTESLLRYVKNELISSATINLSEMSEQDSFIKMKHRFLGEINNLLKEKLPHL